MSQILAGIRGGTVKDHVMASVPAKPPQS